MLYDCAQGNDNMNIELVYASTKGNFAFKDEFDAFAKKSDAIAIHYADEREAAKKITEELIEKHGNDAQYFISGAPSMVEEFKQVVLNKNISEENIVLDIFTGY